MNVLFYFGGFAPLGGIETSARNLLCDLVKRKFRVRLVCWGVASPLLAELKRKGVIVKRIFWRWGCRFNLPDWLMLPAGMIALRGTDVVLFGKPVPMGILYILRHLPGKPTKFILITPYRPTVPEDETRRHALYAQYEPYDRIWVQSALFEADLRAIGYQKEIDVIPYMSEPTQPAVPYPAGPLRIGFLGRLVEDKNIPLLIDAFNLFRKKLLNSKTGNPAPSPVLEIYGDGHLRSDLEVCVRSLGIDSYVRFHGAVPQQQVAKAVATCHLFVFTSHVEGQCLAALEILGCGRPIVATKAGAFQEILQDTRLGRLVSSSNATDVAEVIGQVAALLGIGEMKPTTIQNAYLKSYGADRIGTRYEQLLRTGKQSKDENS